jgi:hypothetical protein
VSWSPGSWASGAWARGAWVEDDLSLELIPAYTDPDRVLIHAGRKVRDLILRPEPAPEHVRYREQAHAAVRGPEPTVDPRPLTLRHDVGTSDRTPLPVAEPAPGLRFRLTPEGLPPLPTPPSPQGLRFRLTPSGERFATPPTPPDLFSEERYDMGGLDVTVRRKT